MHINNYDIIEYLKNGLKYVGSFALKVYGESLNQEGEKAFCDAIELGIHKTIASLYGAKVSDNDILRIVSEHWGISYQEAEDCLIFEKRQAVIYSLKKYLKLQGFSSVNIESFMRKNNVSIRIRREPDLWKLKDTPEKLYIKLQGK